MDPETSSESSSPNSIIEAFPKSRLYPEHWDLSGLQEQAPPLEAPSNLFPGYEPFPKPRTFPSEWNLE